MITPIFERIQHMPVFTQNGGDLRVISALGANLFVTGVIYSAGAGPITITDDLFTIYIPLNEYTSLSGTIKARFWYASNLNPGAGVFFVHYSGTNSFMQAIFLAYGGLNINPFDKQNGGATTGTNSVQPGSILPSEDNELIITMAGYDLQNGNAFDNTIGDEFGRFFLGTFDPGTPEFNDPGVAGQKYPAAIAYKIQGPKNPENPTWTWPAPVASGVAAIVSFKAEPLPPFSFSVDAKRV